jgi:hypothetical protein
MRKQDVGLIVGMVVGGAIVLMCLYVGREVWGMFPSFDRAGSTEMGTRLDEIDSKCAEAAKKMPPCPEPEPCPRCDKPCYCEPDQLHRLEVSLYGLHNQMSRMYDRIGEGIEEIQDARGVVDDLRKTPQEREEEELLREMRELNEAAEQAERDRQARTLIKAAELLREKP